jgi:hypothetical protein
LALPLGIKALRQFAVYYLQTHPTSPVKQICDEFPGFLAKPDISKADRGRYENQFSAYLALLVEFEQTGEADGEKVARIMQDLEGFGQPPPEVLKMMGGNMPGMPPGGGGGKPGDCPTQ